MPPIPEGRLVAPAADPMTGQVREHLQPAAALGRVREFLGVRTGS
ncbi:MAG: hypothetical protein SYR96_01945 [Actinomycetota bacterium]|nr:hypothetical protein [Actinomycetota bacterium]